MNERTDKQAAYKRDILRDYALAASELAAQLDRFEQSGVISFSILRGLLGEPHSKGLLWQLKDTAHHLFNMGDGASTDGQNLDWVIGFLFHECLIILESSYQMQKYYPAARHFAQRPTRGRFPEEAELAKIQHDLNLLAAETQERLGRSIERIRRLLEAANLLMCAYLAGENRNRHLARLFYDREELLRSVFKERYETLLFAVFGPAPERCLLEAAWSLFESGHHIRAERAAQKALSQNPDSAEAAVLLDKITALRQ